MRIRSRCAVGRLDRAVALGGEAEFLHGLAIELQHDLRGAVDQAQPLGVFQVRGIGVLVVQRLGRVVVFPEAAVGDVALQLVGVGRADALAFAVGAAEPGERADAGAAFVVGDIFGVAGDTARCRPA